MRALSLTAAVLLVVGTAAAAPADEKKPDGNKEKLVGAWEVTKSAEGAPPVGAVIEFVKDGKLKVTGKHEGKEITSEGTFTVDGDKVSVTLKHGDREEKHAVTIKKLTATELAVEDEKGKAMELKRKK